MLGFPVSDPQPARAGGAYNLMQGGKILWHPNAVADPVWDAINDLHQPLRAENGTLAYPVEGEIPTAIPGLVRQRSSSGPSTGTKTGVPERSRARSMPGTSPTAPKAAR